MTLGEETLAGSLARLLVKGARESASAGPLVRRPRRARAAPSHSPSTLSNCVLGRLTCAAEAWARSCASRRAMSASSSHTTTDPLRLAPFNPTAADALTIAVQLAALRPTDVLFDLGCGDGRVLLAAAASCPGVRCTGFEFDPAVVERAHSSLRAAAAAGGASADAAARVVVHAGDARAADLSAASVVFVYLVPAGLAAVRAALEGVLARGGRVVSNMFKIPDAEPDETRDARGCKIYLYARPFTARRSSSGTPD